LALHGYRLAGVRMLLDKTQYLFDLLFLGTDHQRSVATTQESASTGEAGSPEILLKQGVDHGIGIFVLDNGNDQLFHDLVSILLSGRKAT
jgi:hypothetical protein